MTEPLDLAAIRAHASPPKRGMFLCPTCADNQIALCDEIERLRADNLERHRICGDLRAALAVRDQNRDELRAENARLAEKLAKTEEGYRINNSCLLNAMSESDKKTPVVEAARALSKDANARSFSTVYPEPWQALHAAVAEYEKNNVREG